MSFTMVGFARARGAHDGERRAGLGDKRHMGERRVAVVGVAEGDVVEGDARTRRGIRPHMNQRLGIANGGSVASTSPQALGGHIGAGSMMDTIPMMRQPMMMTMA